MRTDPAFRKLVTYAMGLRMIWCEVRAASSPPLAGQWDRARPGERILYVGRLAPVPLRTDPPPELVAALAEIPDRRSKVRR